MSDKRTDRDESALDRLAGDPGPMGQPGQPVPQLSRPMQELIVAVWRAQRRLDLGGDSERTLIMVQRHLDAAMSRLQEMGFELRSFEGQGYDPGMRALKPSHFEVDPSVSRETVGETSSPAIFYAGQVAVKSQAAILVPPPKPVEAETPAAAQKTPAAKAKKPAARRKTAKTAPKNTKDGKKP